MVEYKRNERSFVRDLIKALEGFFKVKDIAEKIKIAEGLSTWGLDCRDYSKIPDWSKKACGIPLDDNSKISEEAKEINGMLSSLHHQKNKGHRTLKGAVCKALCF